MQVEGDQNNVRTHVYQVTRLKQVLFDILEHGQNVCARFRLLGELWQTHFVKIISISEDRVLVHDEVSNKLVAIELRHVMQFEIDKKFKALEPYFHYDVVPDKLIY